MPPTCRALAGLMVALTVACVRPGELDPGTGQAEPGAAVRIRFALELAPTTVGPLYALVNDESAQPGWVTVFRDGTRVFLRERCEVEDCGLPPAVCGAAMPMVIDVGSTEARSIETVWDGTGSLIDPDLGCEIRQVVASGSYVARFCYALDADVQGDGAGGMARPGRLVDQECEEVDFELTDAEVVLRR